MIDHTKIFRGGTIDIYDGDIDTAISVQQNSDTQRVTLYTKKNINREGEVFVRPYHTLVEASDCITTVCMLDNRAVKLLMAMYPSAPKYVFVRFAPRLEWLIGFPGLIRRAIFGLVKIKGLAKIEGENNKKTLWLVLEQSGTDVHRIPILPKSVGVKGFLDWLKKERVSYVILRFYEKLPKLHREAGDLDMLVSDQDRSKVEEFLKKHEEKERDFVEDVRVGLHSVSGEPGLIPYYPPPLAKSMLKNSVDGPAESKIPSPEDSLHSFIYHVLYHAKKGYSSGIPSTLSTHIDKYPENDYAGEISKMAKSVSVDVGETMEEMDEYMASVGWRPKLDTLAKIAETNAWVRDRFFSSKNNEVVGLSVFVLREWMKDRGLIEEALKYFDTQGFTVIRNKTLDEELQKTAANILRGGTWGTNADGSTDGWLPSEVVVVIDRACAKLPPSYASGFEIFRTRQLKEAMRNRFDTDGYSSMHSTDNSNESWEYIEICFPEEVEKIKEEVKSLMKPSLFETWKHVFRLSYLKHSLKHSLRSFVIRKFLS